MQKQNLQRPPEDEFTRQLLSEPKHWQYSSKHQTNVNNPIQRQGESTMSHPPIDQTYVPQQNPRQQHEFYIDEERQYMAGGDAELQALKAKYGSEAKEAHPKRSQNKRRRSPNLTYDESSASSTRSVTTTRTAIVQNKKGEQLVKLTQSRASLLKTMDEGLKRTVQDRCCCSKLPSANHCRRVLPKDVDNSASDDSDAYPSSSPSAEVIKKKIVHPMIKKFRLLYLHNIKKEVSIMEDLEMLPQKLDEICGKTEKD